MRASDPDGFFRRYLQLQRELNACVARPLMPTRTFRFGDHCSDCGEAAASARLQETDPDSGANRWICETCGAPWPVGVAFLLQAFEFRASGGRDAAERRADRIRELGRIRQLLGRLTRVEQIVYLLLTLYEGRSPGDAAEEMNRRFRQFPPPHGERGPRPALWSEWGARRTVAQARQALRRELQGQ